jgi:hypothetical protein
MPFCKSIDNHLNKTSQSPKLFGFETIIVRKWPGNTGYLPYNQPNICRSNEVSVDKSSLKQMLIRQLGNAQNPEKIWLQFPTEISCLAAF